MQIEEQHLKIIKSILAKYPYTFYAFGSRVKGNAKQFSDLDIFYKDLIPDHVIVQLEGEFEDSDLPFKMEFISAARCTPEFIAAIEQDLRKISPCNFE